jgi:hypothetical protein
VLILPVQHWKNASLQAKFLVVELQLLLQDLPIDNQMHCNYERMRNMLTN